MGGATVTLGGGTVSGPMSMVNNSFVRLAADMTYNGVLSMGSVGNFTDLQFDGARTLGGTAKPYDPPDEMAQLALDVTRALDEATQFPDPRIWTAERDIEMWKSLEA